MKLLPTLLAAAVAAAVTLPAHAEVAIDVIADNEISFEGLIQADGNWFDEDVADLNSSTANGNDSEFELRRAELVLKGKSTFYDWVLGYDAKADKFLDVNVKWKFSGTTNMSVGQYKQPNSLEELSSTKNNDFISKSVTTNTFAAGRRLGVGATTGGDNWSLSGSAFGREMTRNLAHGSGFGARATWAPIQGDGQLLHLGLSLIDNDVDADSVRLRARPDADLSNRLVDTGTLANTDRQRTVGVEGLWIAGPIKLQGEYMRYTADRYQTPFATGDEFSADSWYVSGLWNLSGETWGYKGGVPTTPLPNDPAAGMWQLGLRYDTIDLDDGAVLGGVQDTVTVGVNYYWRSNFKFAANYVAASTDRRGISDDPNIVEARIQFYW